MRPARERAWHAAGVLAHLVVREWIARQRFTLLGWGWPLLRQFLQVAVLAFVFGRLFDLGIEDYTLFVFTGLIAWTLFAGGTVGGAWSLVVHRHLLLQPRTPVVVIPLVGVLMPALDFLVALPFVLILLFLQGEGLQWAALLAIPILGLQLLLTAGIAWLTSALAVVLRDVTSMVETLMLAVFYLTPVFYELRHIPGDYGDVLSLNPIGILIEAYRDVLLKGDVPEAGPLLGVLGAAVVMSAAGYVVFQRMRPTFVDRL